MLIRRWISPLDVQRLFHQFYDTFIVSYAFISTNDVAAEVNLTEADAEKFYNSHSNLFLVPAKRKVKYVYFPYGLYMDEDSVTTEEIEAYYNEHISQFTISSTDQWSDVTLPLYSVDIEIRNELARQKAMDAAYEAADSFVALITPDRNGNAKSFEDAAKVVRAQVITTEPFAINESIKGVDAKNFNKIAFELKLNNSEEYFSQAIAGKNGYYVLGVIEHTDAFIPSFKDNIKTAMQKALEYAIDEAAEKKMRALKEEFDNRSSISTNTFKQLAKKYRCTVETLDPFSVKNVIEKEDTPEDFYTIMQSVLKLNSGECSDVFHYKNGYALSYVESRSSAEQSILKAVRADFIKHIKTRMEPLVFIEWQKYMLTLAKFEDLHPITQEALTASEDELENEAVHQEEYSAKKAE